MMLMKLNKIRKIELITVLSVLVIFVIICTFFSEEFFSLKPNIESYDIKGIAVAKKNGEIDWKSISEQGITYAFIKATEGSSYSDPLFEQNIWGAKMNKIYVGASHTFSVATLGRMQAKNFINTVAHYQLNIPPVVIFDISFNERGKDSVLQELKLCLLELKLYFKVDPIIYTTYETYEKFGLKKLKNNEFFLKDLRRIPSLLGDNVVAFWLYNDSGKIRGINCEEERVDLSLFMGDNEEFEQFLISNR